MMRTMITSSVSARFAFVVLHPHLDSLLRQVWGDRFEIKGLLGKGSFGQVCEAYDRQTKAKVAIKIIKNKSAFRKQAKTEIELLDLLKRNDPDDSRHMGMFSCLRPWRTLTGP